MQYIEKSAIEPNEWASFFRGGQNRVYLYDNVSNTKEAKEFLLREQHGLCAYCQSPLEVEDASIEHVIPHKQNLNLSTLYHNLVAVCGNPPTDTNDRKHCDKERGDKLLIPLIFYKKAMVTIDSNHGFIDAFENGHIQAKHDLETNIKKQVEAFVEILNLNHETLLPKRKEVWKSITEVFKHLQPHQRSGFWESQLHAVLNNPSKPYRQYLAIRIKKKLTGLSHT